MTARTKASLSKPTHSRNAYVTTNGAEQHSTTHYSLLSSRVSEYPAETRMQARVFFLNKNASTCCCCFFKKHVCMHVVKQKRLWGSSCEWHWWSFLAPLISITSSPATPKGRRTDSFCFPLCWQGSYIIVFSRLMRSHRDMGRSQTECTP